MTPSSSTSTDPPELIKVDEQPSQGDYIALLLGDDDDQSSAERSIVTFLAVPADTLQVCCFQPFYSSIF